MAAAHRNHAVCMESDLEKVHWCLWEKLASASKCITGRAGEEMISRLKKVSERANAVGL